MSWARKPVRYLTDDRDREERYELVIGQGGNGDWYVSVLPEGHRLGNTVRLCESGGASFAVPGLTLAIMKAYEAIKKAGGATALESKADEGGVSYQSRTRPTIVDGKVVTFATAFYEEEGVIGPLTWALGPYQISASRNAVIIHRAEMTSASEVDDFVDALNAACRMAIDLSNKDRGRFKP